ncbi:MAG: 2-C-methyl-D-erythritol 2,4-cyclodiphosphate synthase [Schwartzia sp.]|nr:2-C-methyl-D-erythritol 2,4-cyclodiphosphate synthase [Schwartzia sp. (in: firmicutes)]
MTRFGMGYDVHRLAAGRKLILGGVDIPYEKGLLGHSDADVLLHAIADALLGAAALGDIGKHFPDTEEKWKGADSRMLLGEVARIVREKGYEIGNVDATIVAQSPKLAPYIETMNINIAGTLNIGREQVNVKATTEEHLGFTGSGEGMSSYAVVGIEK